MSPSPAPSQAQSTSPFRWRSHEISRIEGFSDAVFAFAVTLLVVSLEVPETFSELWEKMHGFVAFALCFVALFYVWYEQYIFFRRYALKDNFTVWMNGALIFVVLSYVYPLKFLFSLLVKIFAGSIMVHTHDGTSVPMIESAQFPTLMIIYGLGYLAVSLLFVLLFHHAWRKRAELDLNAVEMLFTQSSIRSHGINISIAVLSIAIVVVLGSSSLSGMIYMIIGPLQFLNGWRTGRRVEKLQAALLN
ncbi:MAG: TMEM175 family protein [candidate division KSB1 bacterium]